MASAIAIPQEIPYRLPYETIDRSGLQRLIKEEGIDNTRAAAGVAVVNVLDYKQFRSARIPGSVNIPREREDEFVHRFHKDKLIVVYGASATDDTSSSAARALALRGFRHVYDYRPGLAEWRATGGLIMNGNV
jgi:rhodanese-related sulfurtransferase